MAETMRELVSRCRRTRTNDPIDVIDVLCPYGMFPSQPQDLVVTDVNLHHIPQEMLGFFGGANCYQLQSMTKNIKQKSRKT